MRPKPYIFNKEREAAIALMKDVKNLRDRMDEFCELCEYTDLDDLEYVEKIKRHEEYIYSLQSELGRLVGYTITSDILEGEEVSIP
ncbi:hypothetical protein IX307_001356 [Bacteroides pyogenes]|uniref:hypothetical protein n=1 Tax=Bacteroides pyogenes TaxID=310300 RepID=UPI001BAB459B|nr:hypothetical protein [Bacteroides pyogenes]MBR8720220.1 hypothetical protein [Bacteroides pyogenes]MBR8725821.1 hypothetical protein [Bacteroides pyogenes]MBR8739471.1 hypothetical protein [Bacteroides pyogenes]MBR8754980.1 hypothetical protein [Bacteroides pyogenes]MBR8787035.1 hypothetical protein [Bacteroides pyogenes]